MLTKSLIGIAIVAIILFVIIVAVQPSEFRVVRSATISVPPATVFAQVNDLHKWEAWSPWEKLDPALRRTYEGPTAGPGATYRWVGNHNVGEGSMTIAETRDGELIRIKLEFIKPFACNNAVEFTFKPRGDQTLVTWSMSGRNRFINKAVCLFMNMDKMVGGQFEKGLATLKSLVESTRS